MQHTDGNHVGKARGKSSHVFLRIFFSNLRVYCDTEFYTNEYVDRVSRNSQDLVDEYSVVASMMADDFYKLM